MGAHRETTLAIDGLVHDLNNVLQTILQAAHLIACGDNPAEYAGLIARSVEEGRRILGLAELDEPVQLEGIAKRAAKFVCDYADVHGFAAPVIQVAVDPEIRIHRPAAIERALTNLFLNAAQAAQRVGPAPIEIRVAAHREAGGIELTVGDNGPGLDEALLARIFKGDLADDSERGLGLQIVARAVRDRGGAIDAANSAAGGAVFTLRFPYPEMRGHIVRAGHDEPR